jgi:ABC1 atypical kinase-like domain
VLQKQLVLNADSCSALSTSHHNCTVCCGQLAAQQVYKATLRSNGAVVAVKVQRPGVLETVSLDLHLVRQLGYLLRKIPALEVRHLYCVRSRHCHVAVLSTMHSLCTDGAVTSY